jgi:hypothetical protein
MCVWFPVHIRENPLWCHVLSKSYYTLFSECLFWLFTTFYFYICLPQFIFSYRRFISCSDLIHYKIEKHIILCHTEGRNDNDIFSQRGCAYYNMSKNRVNLLNCFTYLTSCLINFKVWGILILLYELMQMFSSDWTFRFHERQGIILTSLALSEEGLLFHGVNNVCYFVCIMVMGCMINEKLS